MGNAKYPGENEWEDYLSSHGGSSNAFTDSEFTCYYFDINPSFLHPALQRFAPFFISPLFASSASRREIRAVDQEFHDVIRSDSERLSELLYHTAHQVHAQHPFGKWGWGSKVSLETNLKKQHTTNGGSKASHSNSERIDLRAALRSFHARYYVAPSMRLVVYQATGKLDKMERWIIEEFSAVPSSNDGRGAGTDPTQSVPPDFRWSGHPFLSKELGAIDSKIQLPPMRPTLTNNDGNAGSCTPNCRIKLLTPPSEPTGCLQRIHYVVPVKDVYKLSVSWVLTPSLHPFYAKKSIAYGEHLLAHESRGSLYSLLRSKGFVTELTAGVNEAGNCMNSALSMLQLNLTLTQCGADHIEDILDYTFQYLSLLRRPENISEDIWKELANLAHLSFNYLEAQDPSDMVQQLAIDAHLYPAQHILCGEFLYESPWDREMVVDVLNHLTVSNARIDAVDARIKNKSNNNNSMRLSQANWQKADWFGTEYCCEDVLSESLREKWNSYDQHPERIDPALQLPPSNPFVPRVFDIKRIEKDPRVEQMLRQNGSAMDDANARTAVIQSLHAANARGPQRVGLSMPRGEYWHHLDESFELPRASVHILLSTPAIYCSPHSVACTELLIKLWVDVVNEDAYQASLAEYEFQIESLRSGVEIRFAGFDHKLKVFVERVCRGLKEVRQQLMAAVAKDSGQATSRNNVTDSASSDIRIRFSSLSEKTIRHFAHLYFQPLKQAEYARLSTLQQVRYTIEDISEASHQVSMSDVIEQIDAVMKDVRVVGLVDGNMYAHEAEELFSVVEQCLTSPGSTPPPRVELTLNLPPAHRLIIDQRCRSLKETNNGVEAYYQIGELRIDTRATLLLVESLISEPAFDQLRTKEALGYKVFSGVRQTHGILGFVIAVQSSRYDCQHLMQRIDAFLFQTFYPYLLELGVSDKKEDGDQKSEQQGGAAESGVVTPSSKFLACRKALSDEFLYADTHLAERMDRNWNEISELRSNVFERPLLMSRAVSQVTFERVRELFEVCFLGIRAAPLTQVGPDGSDDGREPMNTSDQPSNVPELSSSPSFLPSPDSAALENLSLSAEELEAKRKEERKAAKKARQAQARHARETEAAASAPPPPLDPATRVRIHAAAVAARSTPAVHRKHLVVCIHGNEKHSKSNGHASSGAKHDTDQSATDESGSEEEDEDESDEEEDDESGSEEDEESEEESDSECSESETDDESVADSSESIVSTSVTAPSVWLDAASWKVRDEARMKKEMLNTAAAASSVSSTRSNHDQPPSKKQRNGRNKATKRHADAAHATAEATSAMPPAAEVVVPLIPLSFDDGVSVPCSCMTTALSASTSASSSSASSVSSTSFSTMPSLAYGEHLLHIRSQAALDHLKSSVPFYPDGSGPEPDLAAHRAALERNRPKMA